MSDAQKTESTREDQRREVYEITDDHSVIRIKPSYGGVLILYPRDFDSTTQKLIGVIRQLMHEVRDLRNQLAARE